MHRFAQQTVIVALCWPWLAGAGEIITGKVVGVHDGDSLTVLDAEEAEHKIRLHGIDAPEKGQPFGARAKQALSRVAFGQTVTVEAAGKDFLGRVLGTVKREGVNVNTVMARQGWAWRFVKHDRAGRYAEAEAEARQAKRGLWAVCGDLGRQPLWHDKR